MSDDQAGNPGLPRPRQEQPGQLTELEVRNSAQHVQVDDLQPPADPRNGDREHRSRNQQQKGNEHPLTLTRGHVGGADLGRPLHPTYRG